MPRREWSVSQRQFLVEKKIQGLNVAQILAEYAHRCFMPSAAMDWSLVLTQSGTGRTIALSISGSKHCNV